MIGREGRVEHWRSRRSTRSHGGMARKGAAITITDIQEHRVGFEDSGAHGRFDQEYVLHERWMAELLGAVASAHGAKALVGAHRGSRTRMVLRAHGARALEQTGLDFLRLLPELVGEIDGCVAAYCQGVPARLHGAAGAGDRKHG